MVADQFPMFKLATQLARQLSSPVAGRVKTYAKSHPRFGTQVCVRVASLYRAMEWGARVWALRLAGAAPSALRHARTPPLPRHQAVDLGGDLIGEVVIFAIGSLIIIFEVNRQAALKETKVLEEKSQWLCVRLSVEELQIEVAQQQLDIQRLHDALRALLDPPSPALPPPALPPPALPPPALPPPALPHAVSPRVSPPSPSL